MSPRQFKSSNSYQAFMHIDVTIWQELNLNRFLVNVFHGHWFMNLYFNLKKKHFFSKSVHVFSHQKKIVWDPGKKLLSPESQETEGTLKISQRKWPHEHGIKFVLLMSPCLYQYTGEFISTLTTFVTHKNQRHLLACLVGNGFISFSIT